MTMKVIFTTMVMFFVSMSVVSAKEKHVCESMGELAYGIMELRQSGLPMSTVMEISDSEVVKAIIIDAYDRPRFSTEEYKQKSMDDFRNMVEVECYKNID